MDFVRSLLVAVVTLATYIGHAQDVTGDTVPEGPNDSIDGPVAFDFFALSDDQRAAHLLEVVRQLDLASAHSGYRVGNIVAGSSQSGYDAASASQAGGTAGYVECWDYRAGYPHKGRWRLRGGVEMQWVKAKARGRCRYVHTGPAGRPPTLGWTLLLMLQQDYDWLGGGGSVWFRQFHKNEFLPVWREDEGTYNGTQVTSGDCENDDYRSILGIYVRPPSGYTYTGPQPLVVDTTDGYVGDCP